MSNLHIESISLTYENTTKSTLNDISLTIPDDGITVVIGPSGCGKTSLLNILAGFIQPTSGAITRNGQPIYKAGADRAVVFQDDALMPWLTVAQNIALGLKIQGLSQQKHARIVEEKLALVHLTHAENQPIWSLSGGMRQRVGIARALAVNSPYLLMDEPFAALDAFVREQMQTLVLDLWQRQQAAFFLITHDIEEALILASQLVLMHPSSGQILQITKPEFNQRWLNGESIRQIKSNRSFIEQREYLLDLISKQ